MQVCPLVVNGNKAGFLSVVSKLFQLYIDKQLKKRFMLKEDL